MENIKVSSAQFEHRSGDKDYNLMVMEELAWYAAMDGSKVIAFHECSVTGYTFARNLDKEQMLELAEYIPEGESIAKLTMIAAKIDIVILAGLFEKDKNENLYKAYVCVGKDGLIAKYRKLHPFINPHLTAGDNYCVFDLFGWKCGILICYDNNIIENVRATKLLGADIIFMPHVTMCTPSTRPGAGFVDPKLWENREADPTSLRQEFDGLKGRAWLMKWLPSRAYDNAVYVVFSNPIGMDDDQLKNGCSMIIDPFGDILDECRTFNDSFATATITPEKLTQAGGYRYLKARRPNLYGEIITQDHKPEQKVAWLNADEYTGYNINDKSGFGKGFSNPESLKKYPASMNDTYKYSAVDLLRTVIEFTGMTPNPDDWSFKVQEMNDPRFIRLQRIMSLSWAFIPEIRFNDERIGIENFYSGEFIRNRKIEDYRNLVNLMDNTISKSDFGNGPKREIHLDHLQFNYCDLLHFYSRMNRLGYNGGLMEISYPYFFSYIVTKSISESMSKQVNELESILSLFIDPFQQNYTLEELIKNFDYPEEDLFETDLDWK